MTDELWQHIPVPALHMSHVFTAHVHVRMGVGTTHTHTHTHTRTHARTHARTHIYYIIMHDELCSGHLMLKLVMYSVPLS